MKAFRAAVMVLLSGTGLDAAASAPVEAVGLFKERAMIRVLGKEHYLKVGQASPEGAVLMESDSGHAVVRFKDQVYQLTLTDQVAGNYQKPTQTNISISPDPLGQYRIQGSINGFYVGFLVDTGASLVAVSERQAKEMGINYLKSSERAAVVTAQGQANAYLVELDNVVVGGIEAHNVRAAVIPGDYPVEVLLGMSFLRKVKMEQQAGVLVLKQDF